jgi:hypothetical protein
MCHLFVFGSTGTAVALCQKPFISVLVVTFNRPNELVGHLLNKSNIYHMKAKRSTFLVIPILCWYSEDKVIKLLVKNPRVLLFALVH